MGYQRSDRGFERDRDYRREDHYGAEGHRGPPERSDYQRDRYAGRRPSGYDYDDRGFFDRAGDELRSWFGDEEAERRRLMDERYAERDRDRGGRSDYRPGVSSYFGSSAAADYGAGRGAGATSNWGLGAGRDREEWGHDPNYHAWRQRQVDALDRDYEDYRREHQDRFNSDFGSWRNIRQTQRQSLGQVREHQEVVGSDGEHIGTVDKIRGDRILLTKAMPTPAAIITRSRAPGLPASATRSRSTAPPIRRSRPGATRSRTAPFGATATETTATARTS